MEISLLVFIAFLAWLAYEEFKGKVSEAERKTEAAQWRARNAERKLKRINAERALKRIRAEDIPLKNDYEADLQEAMRGEFDDFVYVVWHFGLVGDRFIEVGEIEEILEEQNAFDEEEPIGEDEIRRALNLFSKLGFVDVEFNEFQEIIYSARPEERILLETAGAKSLFKYL